MEYDGKCIVCGEKLFEMPIFVQHNMPYGVQNLPTEEELLNDTPIDLEVYQCSKCGLIQLNCEPVYYWRDSTRAGERSSALVELNRKHFRYFIDKCALDNKKIVEIGAGKGGFMQTIAEMPEYDIKLYGLENNSEFVCIANASLKKGGIVYKGFIDAEDYSIKGAPFDAFYSLSFPARLVNPCDVFKGIKNNLKPGGYGFVRTISEEYISNEDGFFEITHDLYAYYGIDSLEMLLQKNGFVIIESWLEPPYVCAIVKARMPFDIMEKWSKIERIIDEVKSFIENKTKNGKRIAVWCASHYAFTVLSICELGNKIPYIIDSAPFKQGRYAPASHVPIVAPEHFFNDRVDSILILSDFYVDEIVKQIKELSLHVRVFSMNKDGIYRIS